ncbi:hypothetical protein [Alicyclobacillus fastidiosus]|uniref:Uncharacterized protein n=1 Tax=Alicyclobacillus fastidiosus TaxID=392011 RepID=A0ABV5ALD9_9BACL|nr:hypothetical protein [Alicyclobacillus fastidiosus]WEH11015.1 hypothetical protein PYS47_07295 [Alicyclobacillus fastidiosus]
MKTYDFRAFLNGQLIPTQKRKSRFSLFPLSTSPLVVFVMDPSIQNAVFTVTST